MPEIIAQVSNLCLSPKEIAIGGVDVHQRFLDEVAASAFEDDLGYDGGYEITPTRALTAAIQFAEQGDGRGQLEGLYSSVHQGWAEKGKYAVFMQRTIPSIRTIERLGRGKRDAVVFGDARHKGKPVDFDDYNFKSAGVQISPEVLGDWNIDPKSSYDAMHDAMYERGLDTIVVDPFHLYRAHRFNGTRIDPISVLESARDLPVRVNRVHLRAGNGDLGTEEDRKHTEQDLAALLEGRDALARSRMGEILLAAYGLFQYQHEGKDDAQFHFVTEVTQAGLQGYHGKLQEARKAEGHKEQPFDRGVRAQYHAVMTANARSLFAA